MYKYECIHMTFLIWMRDLILLYLCKVVFKIQPLSQLSVQMLSKLGTKNFFYFTVHKF